MLLKKLFSLAHTQIFVLTLLISKLVPVDNYSTEHTYASNETYEIVIKIMF